MEYLAEINDTTVDGVIAAHSGTEWWVTSVGFQPGCYQALPLDPAFSISAPKYPRPRQWTPERILCLAGKITSFYPVRSPGGYQLLGRTPVDLYDPLQRNEVFRDSPVLPIAGERHRYVPIDENGYKEIRHHVECGDYRYDIEEGEYSLDDYLARLDAVQVGVA
jgi:allophanate hydrolase subunit 1